MESIYFRVMTKGGILEESNISRGRMSDDRVKNALKAAFHAYAKSDLNAIVEGFSNRRGRKGFTASLEAQRFFDPERQEQGFWYGTPDCLIVAAEKLSSGATEFISKEISRTRGAS